MRKHFFGITITSQALSEPKPCRKTIYNRSNNKIVFHALTWIWKFKRKKKKEEFVVTVGPAILIFTTGIQPITIGEVETSQKLKI